MILELLNKNIMVLTVEEFKMRMMGTFVEIDFLDDTNSPNSLSYRLFSSAGVEGRAFLVTDMRSSLLMHGSLSGTPFSWLSKSS